jgi:methionine sulfoxide reductase heme-binding subunit
MNQSQYRAAGIPVQLISLLRAQFRWVAHLIGLLPLSLLLLQAATQGLTANPIQFLTLRTGKAALIMVVISLACTPVNTLFNFKEALKARRTFGLYAFLYALVHVLIFFGLDYGFDFSLIWADIGQKRFIFAGAGSFLILLPLAVTSFDLWKKLLKKNWKRLHRLVYLGAVLAVVHYIWQVKSDIRVPLMYGLGVAVLLVLRIPAVRKWASGLRFKVKA